MRVRYNESQDVDLVVKDIVHLTNECPPQDIKQFKVAGKAGNRNEVIPTDDRDRLQTAESTQRLILHHIATTFNGRGLDHIDKPRR